MPARRQISAITAAPLVRQRDAGRIVEIRNRVEQLDPPTGRPTGLDRGDRAPRESARRRPSRRARPAPGRRWKVPSAPTYDGASARMTSPGSQKIRVVRSSAICEPTVTITSSGWALMPSSAITWQICSRSCDDALAGPVLQRDQPVLGDQPGGLLGERLQRQRLQVRHAAGERDHLGTAGDGEQCPDGRRAHAAGTLRRNAACAGPGCCRSWDHLGVRSRPKSESRAERHLPGSGDGPNGSDHPNGGADGRPRASIA